MSGMDDLGRGIAEGRIDFTETCDTLISAHIRMFGAPDDVHALELRITNELLGRVKKADWAIERTAIRETQKALGPYTTFFDRQQIAQPEEKTEGFFSRVVNRVREGIGR